MLIFQSTESVVQKMHALFLLSQTNQCSKPCYSLMVSASYNQYLARQWTMCDEYVTTVLRQNQDCVWCPLYKAFMLS